MINQGGAVGAPVYAQNPQNQPQQPQVVYVQQESQSDVTQRKLYSLKIVLL